MQIIMASDLHFNSPKGCSWVPEDPNSATLTASVRKRPASDVRTRRKGFSRS
jgi:hypothetical protein